MTTSMNPMDPQMLSIRQMLGMANGYQELLVHCKKIYPNTIPRIVTSNGQGEPLDYIHVYKNETEPKHWHYIGFGLSDINSFSIYRREHERLRESDISYMQKTQPLPDIYPPGGNGFGFEITFRLKCESYVDPPMWPCRIIQGMADYVFNYKNTFSIGDNVEFPSPLADESEVSRIQHLLMTLDPQLNIGNATLGPVKFIQVVGACDEELQAARRWNVAGVLNFMQERDETGGPLLVTDMRRGQTIFELDPDKHNQVAQGIKETGSNMSQIGAKHKTSHVKPDWFVKAERFAKMREEAGGDDHDMRDLKPMENEYPVRTPSRMSVSSQAESESNLLIEKAENLPDKFYDNLYILLSHESAQVLPVMLEGRLAHGRHFSFQSIKGDSTVTFVPEGCPNEALVNPEQPIVKRAHWLQIYVPHNLREQMYETFKNSNYLGNYSWPEYHLHITVANEL